MNVLNHGQRIARKAHRCDHCLCPIAPGTAYSYAFIKDGGDSWSFRCHTDCGELAWAIHVAAGGWAGDLIEPLDEHEFSDLAPYRGRFPHVICRFEYREQMTEQRFRCWEAVS